jgi:hypothetical protein
MDVTDVIDADTPTDSAASPNAATVGISAHCSAPDRVVFTENGNSEGWIAMDVDSAVSLER